MSVRAEFIPYLLVMAVATYLIRMIPMAVFRTKIKNRFILSFLYYVPYAVLSAMVVPAIFFASGSIITATAGFIVAVVTAFFTKSLVIVASGSCLAVFLAEFLLKYLI